MYRLVPLVATWNCQTSYKNEYAELLVLHLLVLLNFSSHRNVASLSLFYRYYFHVLQNWLNWFHFLFLEGGLLVTLTDCMNFLSPFLDVTRVSVNSFFPRTARPWNPLLIECFPSTYNQNGFKGCVRYVLASLFFKSKRRHL